MHGQFDKGTAKLGDGTPPDSYTTASERCEKLIGLSNELEPLCHTVDQTVQETGDNDDDALVEIMKVVKKITDLQTSFDRHIEAAKKDVKGQKVS